MLQRQGIILYPHANNVCVHSHARSIFHSFLHLCLLFQSDLVACRMMRTRRVLRSHSESAQSSAGSGSSRWINGEEHVVVVNDVIEEVRAVSAFIAKFHIAEDHSSMSHQPLPCSCGRIKHRIRHTCKRLSYPTTRCSYPRRKARVRFAPRATGHKVGGRNDIRNDDVPGHLGSHHVRSC